MIFLIVRNWHLDIAAVFLMSISFICMLLPILGFVIMFGNKVSKIVNNSAQVVEVIKNKIGVIASDYG